MLLDADGDGAAASSAGSSPHAGVDALVATAAAIVEELDAARRAGRRGRGRARRPRRPRAATRRTCRPCATRRCATRSSTRRGHPLVVDNDANVATLGEVDVRRGDGRARTCCSSRSEPVSAAACCSTARSYRGAHDFGAEIGHFTVERDGPLCACGERGPLGGDRVGHRARPHGARARRAGGGGAAHRRGRGRRRRRGDRRCTSSEAARAGDADALALLGAVRRQRRARAGRRSRTCSIPSCIVIAGGLVELGPLLFDPLQASFMRHIEGAGVPARTIPIVPAELGERAGAVGAAVLARELAAVSVRIGLTLPVVRRRSRDPDRGRARGRGRRARRACSCTTTCGAAIRPTGAPRSSASRCSARSRPRRRASTSARSSRGRRCGRRRRSPTASLTAQRVSGGRLIAGIGAGDSQSRAENEAFGLEFGTMVDRVSALHDAVRAARGRRLSRCGSAGAPRRCARSSRSPTVGTAGAARPSSSRDDVELVREVAPDRDDHVGRARAHRRRRRGRRGRRPERRSVAVDVLVGGPARLAEQLDAFVEQGAEWVILGPIDSTDPTNADALGEVRRLLNS